MPVIEPVNQQVINTVLSVEEQIPTEYQYSENERELYGSFLRIACIYVKGAKSLRGKRLPSATNIGGVSSERYCCKVLHFNSWICLWSVSLAFILSLMEE